MAPPTPSHEHDDLETWAGVSAPNSKGSALQRFIVEAHEKLEARLVATIELREARLLQALACAPHPGPWSTGREGGDLGAAPRSADCVNHVAPIQNDLEVAQLGSRETLEASLSGLSGDETPNIEGACVREQDLAGLAEPGAARTPHVARLGLSQEEDEDDSEDEDEGEEFDRPRKLSRRVSGRLEAADTNLKQTRSIVIKDKEIDHSQRCIVQSPSASRVLRISSLAELLLERREFELFISMSIVANAASIGLSADFSIKHPGEHIPQHFRILDYCFMGVFAAELALRLAAEGGRYFNPRSRSFAWNVFDALLVGATVLNEGAFGMNLSVVRIFRILRLVNTIRSIRLMSGFRELRMMVTGIMNCGKTLFWSILLLSIVAYIYAVFCIQLSSEWLASNDIDGAIHRAQSISTVAFLDRHFPSLDYGIYTLFKTMSGGISWGEIADPLEDVSVLLLISFPLYIAITVFCVLNIITAAFVDAAARTRQDEDTNALEHIEERREWIAKIRQLFSKHDTDHDNSLDWEEFQTVMGDWRTQQYFIEIGLNFDFQRAQNLFRLFDWDGNGTIDVDEFAQGVHHLRGNARSLDMFREFQSLNRRMEKSARQYERALTLHRRDRKSRSSSSVGKFSTGSNDTASRQEFWNDEPSRRTRRQTFDATRGAAAETGMRSVGPPCV